MLWIGLVEPVTHALCNIMDERIGDRFDGAMFAFLVVTEVAGLGALLPLWLAFGLPLVPSAAQIAALAGLAACQLASLFCYYRALRHADTSVVVAYFELGYLASVVLATLWLAEIPNIGQIAGISLILFASLWSLLVRHGSARALGWMIACVSLGAVSVVGTRDLLDRLDWVTVASWGAVFPTIFLGTILLAWRDGRVQMRSCLPIARTSVGLIAVNSILGLSGEIGSVAALSYLDVATVQGLSSLQSLFVLAFGYALYRFFPHFGRRESFEPAHALRKSAMVAMIVTGVALVAWHSPAH
jgi:drug/metabolite transporter (DMT)-like permease